MIDTAERPLIDIAAALREGYRDARAAGMARHRDIAQHLGVSEAALIAAHVHLHAHAQAHARAPAGPASRRLVPRWSQIVKALEGVGEVMALTRNASCVHEKTGRFENADADGESPPVGLVLGTEIDLRVFYRQWAHGFAVDEVLPKARGGVQRSLQFFDAAGSAIHKVFVKPQTDLDAWNALVAAFEDRDDVSSAFTAKRPAPRAAETPDDLIDTGAFREAWAALRDTHEFFGLLKKHGVSRTQALRLAEPRFAQAVDNGSARELLRAAAGSATPIMVFVGNPGMIQIHSGAVKRIEVLGPWLNVLDPRFNLHLREDHVAQSWVVRKPTSDGIVTSLELFDADGETIAMFFGERKPGRPELGGWRRIAERLVDDGHGGSGECATC